MRRTLQTVAIPVFQFGMFSETDLAFHAGAEDFSFGGRVHTNGNLFLAAADGGTLTIADRITAFKDIIRTHLPNGLATTSGYTGNVRIPTTIAAQPGQQRLPQSGSDRGQHYRDDPPGRTRRDRPGGWVGLSQGTYLSNIRNGDTGAKELDLPIVADLDGNGVPDARPIELIRRPAQARRERRHAREHRLSAAILRAGQRAHPAVGHGGRDHEPADRATAAPVDSDDRRTAYAGTAHRAQRRRSRLAGRCDATAAWPVRAGHCRQIPTRRGTLTTRRLLGGFIKIEMHAARHRRVAGRDGRDARPWHLGPKPRRLTVPAARKPLEHRRQLLRHLHVPRTQPECHHPSSAGPGHSDLLAPCGITPTGAEHRHGADRGQPGSTDYWPNTLYDPREGHVRDGLGDTNDIDSWRRDALRRARRQQPSAMAAASWFGAERSRRVGEFAKNDNGFIVYFSDRRNNKNSAATPVETGEYGWEDTVNLGNAAMAPSTTSSMRAKTSTPVAEPLEQYGRIARNHRSQRVCAADQLRPWSPTS